MNKKYLKMVATLLNNCYKKHWRHSFLPLTGIIVDIFMKLLYCIAIKLYIFHVSCSSSSYSANQMLLANIKWVALCRFNCGFWLKKLRRSNKANDKKKLEIREIVRDNCSIGTNCEKIFCSTHLNLKMRSFVQFSQIIVSIINFLKEKKILQGGRLTFIQT